MKTLYSLCYFYSNIWRIYILPNKLFQSSVNQQVMSYGMSRTA